MSRNTGAITQLLAACCYLITGCSGSGRPAIAPVWGQVTYRGEPVADATVVYLCPGAPRLAVGKTDDHGKYRLTTYEPNDGAMVGTHAVTVKKYKLGPAEPDASAANVESMDQAGLSKAIEKSMHASAQHIARAEKAGSAIPVKYSNAKTSDLHKAVVHGENIIDLNLTD